MYHAEPLYLKADNIERFILYEVGHVLKMTFYLPKDNVHEPH